MSSDPADTQSDELDGLYRELYPTLVRFSQGIVGSQSDAEDAVQDAFVAAAGAKPADDPRPWLFRITRNASIDLLRRRRPSVSLNSEGAPNPSAVTSGPHDAAVLSERLELLRIGLEALPERGRAALLLRELAGLPYSEISQVLDTSEGNVKILIFRARASLHELAEAAELECAGVRVALSAAADGEVSRGARARANLHTLHCRSCRRFVRSIGSQQAGVAALIPIGFAPQAVHVSSGGATVGGGIATVKTALAGLFATAAVGVTAGGVVVLHEHRAIPQHASQQALAGPTKPKSSAPAVHRQEARPAAGSVDANPPESVDAHDWEVDASERSDTTSGGTAPDDGSGDAGSVSPTSDRPEADAPPQPSDAAHEASDEGTHPRAATGSSEASDS